MAAVRTSDEIRRAFTDFFVERGHLAVPSASLVPSALDQSVLLTTAGMQPFKPFFLGQETPPRQRLTSVQRCFRAVDIDVVGSTERHMTFFQMMGNFSFGDYFKPGAVEMAWELSTGAFGLDPERIWATVYEGDDRLGADDVARELWLGQGVPASRIVAARRGQLLEGRRRPGPCGPCSELYYDRGAEHGCGGADCKPGCDCDRFLEFWNLVFMEFDRGGDGSLTPLPAQNIDTGSGLERVAMLLQEAGSIYETDQTTHVISALEQLSGKRYADGGDAVRSFRVLCDHGRGMAAVATDGVTPSNEGRGYVLRRIIRRAVLHGSRLGLDGAVPGRAARGRDRVAGRRLPGARRAPRRRPPPARGRGGALLADARHRLAASRRADEPGQGRRRVGPARRRRLRAARHARLPRRADGRDRARGRSRDRPRGLRAAHGAPSASAPALPPAAATASTTSASRASRAPPPRSEFVGYHELEAETTVLAVEPVGEGLALVKLARSPFYPEGGGQVSDGGEIAAHAVRGQVESVYRLDGDQALLVRLEGELRPGDTVHARVDARRRRPTMANHTGTHLLQRALRNQLGEHVRQAGSAVRPEGLRFDFTHPVAALAGGAARGRGRGQPRRARGPRAARSSRRRRTRRATLGATMLFGEKYGDIVRVVDITGYSMELCGGTHVRSTAAVGPFTIVRESSVGQGVRRIEAITGPEALGALRRADRTVRETAASLRTPPEKLPEAVAALSERVRELEKAAKAGGARQRRRPRPGGAERRRGRARPAQGARRRGSRGHARRRPARARRPPARVARARPPSCSARATASACSSSRA